jgi:hypothetical protein
MPKSWGGCLGRKPRDEAIISAMSRRAAQMKLSIEIGSEPISGSVSVSGGNSQQFCGWIELVETIELARETGSSGGDEGFGPFAGASGGSV